MGPTKKTKKTDNVTYFDVNGKSNLRTVNTTVGAMENRTANNPPTTVTIPTRPAGSETPCKPEYRAAFLEGTKPAADILQFLKDVFGYEEMNEAWPFNTTATWGDMFSHVLCDLNKVMHMGPCQAVRDSTAALKFSRPSVTAATMRKGLTCTMSLRLIFGPDFNLNKVTYLADIADRPEWKERGQKYLNIAVTYFKAPGEKRWLVENAMSCNLKSMWKTGKEKASVGLWSNEYVEGIRKKNFGMNVADEKTCRGFQWDFAVMLCKCRPEFRGEILEEDSGMNFLTQQQAAMITWVEIDNNSFIKMAKLQFRTKTQLEQKRKRKEEAAKDSNGAIVVSPAPTQSPQTSGGAESNTGNARAQLNMNAPN